MTKTCWGTGNSGMTSNSKGKNTSSKGKGFAKDPDSYSNSGRKGKGAGGFGPSHAHHGSINGELPKELEPLSRELVQLLRHKGLQQLRSDGFAPLRSVVAALRSKPSSGQVEAVTLLSKRDGLARFELLEENGEKWIRAREKHSLRSVELPSSKVDVEAEVDRNTHVQEKTQRFQECDVSSAVREAGHAIQAFDASPYGDEYLSLEEGEKLTLHKDVDADSGWVFGNTSHAIGWFPASLWKSLRQEEHVNHNATKQVDEFDADKKAMNDLSCAQEELCAETLLAELTKARAEIKRLETELSKEKTVSAKLRQELDESRSIVAPLGVNRFSKQKGLVAGTQTQVVDRTDKQKLLTHLSEVFPDIKNEGVKYDIVESRKDAEGRFQWLARVEITELSMTFDGEHCQSKADAEQSAAFRALRELGGFKGF